MAADGRRLWAEAGWRPSRADSSAEREAGLRVSKGIESDIRAKAGHTEGTGCWDEDHETGGYGGGG